MRIANIGEDANTIITESVTKVNGERHDSASASVNISNSNSSNVSWNMTTIKGSATPGTPRQLNVLSNFKYEYFVAGISGGVVSTLMLHPLDLIKIRFAGESRARRRERARKYGGCFTSPLRFARVTASTWYRYSISLLTRVVCLSRPTIFSKGLSWSSSFFLFEICHEKKA